MDQSDEEDVGGSSILEMFDAVFTRKVMLNHGDALTTVIILRLVSFGSKLPMLKWWWPSKILGNKFHFLLSSQKVGLSRHGNMFGIGVSI